MLTQSLSFLLGANFFGHPMFNLNENLTDANWAKRLDRQFASQAYGNAKKLFNKVTDTFNKTYVAEDDIWRIASFQKELNVLKKAFPNRSIDELEKEAANIIRNTFPTYNLVPLGARELRKVPIFGNFYSFHSERFRNTIETYKRGWYEINSNNKVLMQRGFDRLAGKLTYGAFGTTAVSAASRNLLGVTEEDDRNYKNLY